MTFFEHTPKITSLVYFSAASSVVPPSPKKSAASSESSGERAFLSAAVGPDRVARAFLLAALNSTNRPLCKLVIPKRSEESALPSPNQNSPPPLAPRKGTASAVPQSPEEDPDSAAEGPSPPHSKENQARIAHSRFRTPTLRKVREGYGTLCVDRVEEIKNERIGHPPAQEWLPFMSKVLRISDVRTTHAAQTKLARLSRTYHSSISFSANFDPLIS